MRPCDRERAIGLAMLQAHAPFTLSGWPRRPAQKAQPDDRPPPPRDPVT